MVMITTENKNSRKLVQVGGSMGGNSGSESRGSTGGNSGRESRGSTGGNSGRESRGSKADIYEI
jgi:hypothetical protein